MSVCVKIRNTASFSNARHDSMNQKPQPNGPLPHRDGISPSRVSLPVGAWATVTDFLVERFPHIGRETWLERMTAGLVIDENGNRIQPDQPYQAHRNLYYYRHLEAEAPIPFEEAVLYQDEYIVVADKPHFLPVTPGGRYLQETLLVRLKRKLDIDTLAPAHRIDRETAGLVLFTIQPHTRGRYQSLFQSKTVSKQYQALAPLRDDLPLPMTYRSRLVESDAFMQMQETGGEANAETEITLLETLGALARYQLRPLTGRKHQLRAQMAALGIPIANDQIYPVLQPEEASSDYRAPLQLLAESLSFVDPITGIHHHFKSQFALQP